MQLAQWHSEVRHLIPRRPKRYAPSERLFQRTSKSMLWGHIEMWAALSEGATTVQMYTALVFEGPSLIHKILKEYSTLTKVECNFIASTMLIPKARSYKSEYRIRIFQGAGGLQMRIAAPVRLIAHEVIKYSICHCNSVVILGHGKRTQRIVRFG